MSDDAPSATTARECGHRQFPGSARSEDTSGRSGRGRDLPSPALEAGPSSSNVYLLDCGGGEWALVDTGCVLPASREAFAGALQEIGIEPGAVTRSLATTPSSRPLRGVACVSSEIAGDVYLHPAEAGAHRVHPVRRIGGHGSTLAAPRHPDSGRGRRCAEADAGSGPARSSRPPRSSTRCATARSWRSVADACRWSGRRDTHRATAAFSISTITCSFVGDHAAPRITPHVGVYATGPENPLADFLASQEKVAALDVRMVCPAHGGVFADHRHRARQLIAHHEVRAREMWDALRAQPGSAYSVARKAFRWVFENASDRFQAGAAVMGRRSPTWRCCAGVRRATRDDVDGVLEYRAVEDPRPRHGSGRQRQGRGGTPPPTSTMEPGPVAYGGLKGHEYNGRRGWRRPS